MLCWPERVPLSHEHEVSFWCVIPLPFRLSNPFSVPFQKQIFLFDSVWFSSLSKVVCVCE